jgi:hypothetical protein
MASIFLWTSIPAIRYDIGLSSWERRACLVASIRVASYCRAKHGDAQLFGQSRTLRIKQLLGRAYSMANLDLAAPSAAILHTRRFSCLFAGRWAQLQPVAEIVQCGEPIPCGGFDRLALERQMHALVAAALLRMAWLNALDLNAEAKPPDGELLSR